MNFDVDKDITIFDPIFKKRPEIDLEKFKLDLKNYYLPYVQKLIDLKNSRNDNKGIVIGVSAIQGAGKTTQGEILECFLDNLGHFSLHLSIDDHYVTHQQLNEIRSKDPRYIRRGVTHDIPLALSDLTKLREMRQGEAVFVSQYDKGAYDGDGDRTEPRKIDQKPDFIFYDGWFTGVRKVDDESVFEQNLPALETPEAKQFAKDVNRKLADYEQLWEMFDFLNVLFVPHYEMALKWREEAEKPLRQRGGGMSSGQIVEFVHYFWRSVHPAIQITNLAKDAEHTNQVAIISDDHSIKEILTPLEVASKYS